MSAPLVRFRLPIPYLACLVLSLSAYCIPPHVSSPLLQPENPSSTHCRDGGVTPTNVESRADIDWCDEMDKVPPHPPAGYDWHGQPQHLKISND